MKRTRKLITTMLAAALLAALVCGAATAALPTLAPGEMLWEIRIEDETGEFPAAGIVMVWLQDTSNGTSYEFGVDPGFGLRYIGIMAGSTYSVTLEYPKSDEFEVVNKDGSKITLFHAPQGGHVSEWKIAYKGAGQAPEGQGGALSEPMSMFQRYYDLMVAYYKDNSNDWESIWWPSGELYEKYVGGTMEEWLEKSLAERQVYNNTYLSIMRVLDLKKYDWYFGDYTNYRQNTIGSHVFSSIFGPPIGDEAEINEAYLELMKWQYDYVVSHGKAYDFMAAWQSGNWTVTPGAMPQTPGDIGGIGTSPAPGTVNPDVSPRTAVIDDPSPPLAEGIWEAPIAKLSSMWITLIVLAVLLVALAVVFLIKRGKAAKE